MVGCRRRRAGGRDGEWRSGMKFADESPGMKFGGGESWRPVFFPFPPASRPAFLSPIARPARVQAGPGRGARRGPVVRKSTGLPFVLRALGAAIAAGRGDRRWRNDGGEAPAEFASGAGNRRARHAPALRRNADRENTDGGRSRPRAGCAERAGADAAGKPRRRAGGGRPAEPDPRVRAAADAATEPSRRDSGRNQGQRPRVERRTMRPLLFMTPTVLPWVTSFASSRSLSFATAMYTGPR